MGKKIILCLLVVGMLFCAYPTAGKVSADFTGIETVTTDSGVVIAEAGKYKNYDYNFLASFVFGDEAADKVQLTFETVDVLKNSTDIRLKEGRYVSTKGYHTSGDKGGATYIISATKAECGSVTLTNGLYANIINDTHSFAGLKWAIVSVKQYGAYGNGTNSDQNAINEAIKAAGECVGKNGVLRALIYVPSGEYKVTDQIHINSGNINLVGDGDNSIIFTDNDYRKNDSYYEFFIMVQEVSDVFLANFRVEAREKDVYKYMRQIVINDCINIYLYNISMIVPMEAWSGFYYEDKQYTNLTLYSGNKNVTVDGCYMEQMSGTYRGANLGILDFWQRGEENITVMNCEFHDNARDEQIGIFSLSGSSSSYIKNVDFINNTIYSYKPPHINLYGNRQMCFTVAYADSPNVSDINISGNHFISEVDSKLMTFGKMTQCVVKNNIFEIKSSYGVYGMVFDSSNSDASNVLICNNEFYMTGRDDVTQGKASMSTGKLTFKDNRVVTDACLYGISGKYGVYTGNTIIGISGLGTFGDGIQFDNNKVIAYKGLDKLMSYNSINYEQLNLSCINNNIINYGFKNEGNNSPFTALNNISDSTFNGFTFSQNTYICPNFRYSEDSRNYRYNHILYFKQNSGLVKNITITNNTLEGAKGVMTWGDVSCTAITDSQNTYNEFSYNGAAKNKETVVIKNNGTAVTELTVYGDTVNLQAVTSKDVDWVSSVTALATVENGVVKRQKFGTVVIYAMPKDGVSEPAKCIIHFAKQKATDIQLDSDSVIMQPGYVRDVAYKVLPYNSATQKLKWSSSNEAVAKVDEYGVINAVAVGTANITCKTIDGSNLTKTIKVTVENVTVKKINLNYSYKYFDTQSGTVHLKADSYTPNNAVNKSVGKWVSTNSAVATVDSSGLVTIKSGGVATIRAYTTDNKYYSECEILVKPNAINSLSTSSVGKNTIGLKWASVDNVYGYNIYRYNNTTAKWDKIANTTDCFFTDRNLQANTNYKYSVKAYIARWDSTGRIEYTGNDSNILNVTTYSYEPVNNINLQTDRVSCSVGEKTKVAAKVYPLNADNKDLVWSVADTSIATVEFETSASTQNIFVKGVAEGVTTLTAKAKDGVGYSVTIPVVVLDTERPKPVELTPKYKDMTIKWEAISDENNVDGYVIYRTASIEYTAIKYIPKASLKTTVNSSGKKCYVYTDTGLKQDINYGYKVAPYVEYNNLQYSGRLSNEVRAKLLPYVNVDSIIAEEEYVLNLGETRKIYAMVDVTKNMIPDFVWQLDNSAIASVTPLNSQNTKDTAYANIKGISTGITRLNIIANDSTGYFIMPKVVVLPGSVAGINASVNALSITISWNVVNGADGYFVYLYDENNEYINKYKVNVTSTVINELMPYKTYGYKVCAYLEDGEGIYEGTKSTLKTITTGEIVDNPESSSGENSSENTKNPNNTTNENENSDGDDYYEDSTLESDKTDENELQNNNEENETSGIQQESEDGSVIGDSTSASDSEMSDTTMTQESNDAKKGKKNSGLIWFLIPIILLGMGGIVVCVVKKGAQDEE